MKTALLLVGLVTVESGIANAMEGDAITRDPTTQSLYARGRIEPVERVKELGFEKSGRIHEIYVTEGQWIKGGTEIARLDDAVETGNVHVRRAEVVLAHARLAELERRITIEEIDRARALVVYSASREHLATLDANRAERLYKEGIISRQEMDRSVAASRESVARHRANVAELDRLHNFVTPEMLSVARKEIAVAEAAVQKAEADLGRTIMYAPSDGTVLRMNFSVGDLFLAEAGIPVCLFADLEQVWVRAQVDELQIAHLRSGQKVEIRGRGLGDAILHGRIKYMLPIMGERRMFNRFPEERLDLDVQELFIELLTSTTAPIGLEVDVMVHMAYE